MTARGQPRFEVWVSTHPPGEPVTKIKRSGHHQQRPAFLAVCDIVKQWAASEGAITPGTTVSIVDTNDGGNLLVLAYLGFEPATITGMVATWPGTQRPMREARPAWPR